MKNAYVSQIDIVNVRNIENFSIDLGTEERKHLIITGKNGSGKSTLLNQISIFLQNALQPGTLSGYRNLEKAQEEGEQELERLKARVMLGVSEHDQMDKEAIIAIQTNVVNYKAALNGWGGTRLRFNDEYALNQCTTAQKFVSTLFTAKRETGFNKPLGITKLHLPQIQQFNDRLGYQFVQYMVNLKADMSFARDDSDEVAADRIARWFENFRSSLCSLYENDNIQLTFDRGDYNYFIKEDDKFPYDFNQLSDGYSAILNIMIELIIRMEAKFGQRAYDYDIQGIVLIDEIEVHLHVDLQKKVLPFLTKFFPNIQFIVTTHSPFVLSSVENAVICDLENRLVTSDLSGYSYSALIESYFGSDKFSIVLKNKVKEYEALMQKETLTEVEKLQLHDLQQYFDDIPQSADDDLAVKLLQIKMAHLGKVRG